ncbi:hypothetical protein PSEUDO9AG_41041 [Pseudomonas sp. 9Ag]|nr:hypothetical protein PSEUDO9AG_41041 [Pseudomonas sp. 9Ag]
MTGGALEQTATTCGKQRIATQKPRVLSIIMKIGDVAAGMPRDLEHLQLMVEDANALSIDQRFIPGWNFFHSRAVDRGGVSGFKLLNATYMVMVVVSDQNVGQLPAGASIEPFLNWARLTRIYRSAEPALWILQHPDVVVGEGGQSVYFQHMHGSPIQ